jgi:twitching motility two-component system response regulator PilH
LIQGGGPVEWAIAKGYTRDGLSSPKDTRRPLERGRFKGKQSGSARGNHLMARILIVDDSPSQLLGIKRIVEKLGHEAITAEDGAAGVEAAKRELPDLILMDVVMPNLNGFQATRTISKEETTKHIPIILVTTKDQDTDKVWGLRQGAKDYVVKPIKEEELVKALKTHLPA